MPKRIVLNGPEWAALSERKSAVYAEPITARTSLVNGQRPEFWDELDLGHAWIDPGPSPAGWAGPYLKAPRRDDETVHRIYPRSAWEVGDVVHVAVTGASVRGIACIIERIDIERAPNDPCAWRRLLTIRAIVSN